MDTFAAKDNRRDENDYHKQVKALTKQPANTADDREFTIDEISNIIQSMNNVKVPGEDGKTGVIYNHAFKTVPTFITAIYNGCLKQGIFQIEWRKARQIPIIKPGKENSYEVSKYRPISLLNIGGKVLEKLMINRINHHGFTTPYINKNQYVFMPPTSTIDAVMPLKDYIEEGFRSEEVAVLVNLDVEGAFNSACWPSILKCLNDSGCRRNLQNLTKIYLSKRLATLQTNNIKIEAEITKGWLQGSCCGPGLWNIYYNSLPNFNYTHRTKTIAFADDLILVTRGKTITEAENIANIELTKISSPANANKIHFNEQKSKTMFLSRRKRTECKDLEVYLNFRPPTQVLSLKYLGIIQDTKLTFREHINYITEKSSNLIFALSKSAKLNWGLSHTALKTIYTGVILPVLLYGAPISIKAINKACYRIKFSKSSKTY
jgi:hypothetical protein